MSVMIKIISTELPQYLVDDITYGTNNDNAKAMENARQTYVKAQRDAILRFCEAVDAEAEANTLKITKAYVDDHLTVFNKLRDELAKEK